MSPAVRQLGSRGPTPASVAAVGIATGIFAGILSGQLLPGFFFGVLGAVTATLVELQSKR
jgi:hypothetical protein